MKLKLQRMWINQPSTLQTHHKLHGVNVLVAPEWDDTVRVYFTSGDVVSMKMSKFALSKGWK